jgi:hypothetical protein
MQLSRREFVGAVPSVALLGVTVRAGDERRLTKCLAAPGVLAR